MKLLMNIDTVSWFVNKHFSSEIFTINFSQNIFVQKPIKFAAVASLILIIIIPLHGTAQIKFRDLMTVNSETDKVI